jgi:tagatose 6-phosphate kinase
MITVGGFNTAVDETLEVDQLALGEVSRARGVRRSAGGKGVHVALAIAALGEPVQLVGLIDAAHRREFEDVLGRRGVKFHGVDAGVPIRTCHALLERASGRVTEILEPGPPLEPAARRELCDRYLALASPSSLAILTGSAPAGFDDGAYAELVAELRTKGVECLVDASGGLLRRAVEARPFLVKPNRDEAQALSGEPIRGPQAAANAARKLRQRGISIAIVTLAKEGAVAVGEAGALHARVDVPGAGSAVGSGDCLLGGVAVGLARGLGLEDMLRLGVACGAANTLASETACLRREDVDALQSQVSIACDAGG